MNDKYIWYKEVLDIEPQSRLFFPLARMMADDGALEEARAVLENGLSYHVHFVQARMLLAEVLQKLGRKDEAESQFALVTGEFRENASFWQSFADTSAKNKDESVIRRMMSLQLRNVPTEFSDIMSRGLDSLEKEYSPEKEDGDAKEYDLAKEYGTGYSPERNKDAGISQASQPEPAPAESLEKHEKEASANTGTRQASEPDFAPSSSFETVLTVPHPISCSILRTVPMQEGTGPVSAAGSSAPKPAPKPAESPVEKPAAATSVSAAAATVTVTAEEVVHDSVQDFADDADEPVQGWPPKTRSMAEVFVEQGEYAEALSIYRELIARAGSPEKAGELQRRLAEIKAMAGSGYEGAGLAAQASEASPKAADEPEAAKNESTVSGSAQDNQAAAPAASGSSDELLAMLEKLASRVEARVR
ncbi:MAG: tetratricopeptide repeat protein [Desulfovibrionaceae bacterium]|nr:tetratricopeptide repeat protein [Desulfovibrionaceae bacterium]